MVTQETASMEDYLEVIAVLGEGKKAIRITQLSKALRVKNPVLPRPSRSSQKKGSSSMKDMGM
jgi:hypothetical protein